MNFLVPLIFAEVVRILEEGSKVSPWPYLCAYVGLRFLQSSGGLAALRDVGLFSDIHPFQILMLLTTDTMGSSNAVF